VTQAPKTCAGLPGRCKLVDSQLYQRHYEKYGSCYEDWFLFCIFNLSPLDKIFNIQLFQWLSEIFGLFIGEWLSNHPFKN
jgi:hypothetical protein